MWDAFISQAGDMDCNVEQFKVGMSVYICMCVDATGRVHTREYSKPNMSVFIYFYHHVIQHSIKCLILDFSCCYKLLKKLVTR